MSEWIRCDDRMPEERETMFAKFWGTDKWKGNTWRNKSEVTMEALRASAVYLLENNKEYQFQRKSDGKWFAMRISEIEPKEG